MGKFLPILLAIIGLGAGVGAGLALRPLPEPETAAAETCPCECGADPAAFAAEPPAPADADPQSDFVKLNNQFVVPVVHDEKVAALVVMSLSLEVPVGGSEGIYQREPKLRDEFLQVLFDHANAGGFDGAFTTGPKMDALRTALYEVARGVLGANLRNVLITDIARQDY